MTVVLAFNLSAVRKAIRRIVERAMATFEGPRSKCLRVHTVAGLAGGTGSASVIPVTMLLHETVRSIDRTLQLEVVLHAVAPSLFVSKVDTWSDEQRLGANGYMTLCEISLGQTPRKLEKMAAYLGINAPTRPLFDELVYYDQVDSGSKVQSIPEMWDRLAGNILAGEKEDLRQLEQARDVNGVATRQGDGFAEAIVCTEYTSTAQVPVQKLSSAYAHSRLGRRLESLNVHVGAEMVDAVKGQLMPSLELEQTRQKMQEMLSQTASLLSSGAIKRGSRPDVIRLLKQTAERWRRDRKAAIKLVISVGKEAKQDAVTRAKKFVAKAEEKSHSLPQVESVVRQTLEELEERDSLIQAELEARAMDGTSDRVFQDALAKAEQAPLLRWGASREAACRAYNAMVIAFAETLAKREYREHVIQPIIGILRKALERIEHTQQQVISAYRHVNRSVPEVIDLIGISNTVYSEVISTCDVNDVLTRMLREIPAKCHGVELSLQAVLQAEGEEDFQALMEEALEQGEDQAQEYFTEVVKDIEGFVERFGLEFDLDAWISGSLDFTLPANLNLAVVGRSDYPLRIYLVAPKSMKHRAESAGFEFCGGSNPFEVAVRGKISRVPFRAIPGIEEMHRHYTQFMVDAKGGRLCSMLHSHGALEDAHKESLLDPSGCDEHEE
ncbi:MAG: hypothetical protein GXX96_32990 [Planctomycetaceae bacterium]|nr:hypothetical protein [Planctomycetaceae bacterium]